jgi:hypothetical protein
MYQVLIPGEYVIYVGHVVLLLDSVPRSIDRAGKISERNAKRKQWKAVPRKMWWEKSKT